MYLDHTPKAVVIGDAERGISELGSALYELQWMRSPVEEAVIGMGMELRVPCHSVILVERMFDYGADIAAAECSQLLFVRSRCGWQTGSVPSLMDVDGLAYEDELSEEGEARLRRRSFIRKVIVIIVVVVMVVTLVVPLIVRVVRAPSEPDGIVAVHAPAGSRRMTL